MTGQSDVTADERGGENAAPCEADCPGHSHFSAQAAARRVHSWPKLTITWSLALGQVLQSIRASLLRV